MIYVKSILYPTDFSTYSNQAYFHALALAETHGASLTILHVYVPGTTTPETPVDRAADREHWRNELLTIRPLDPGIPVHHVLAEGDPATEILRCARDAGADLIVMGTHGRTGIQRLLMGSVAEQVMRKAPCSVLVVKLPGAAAVGQAAEPALATDPG
jgi:nucleotide-binding universal stress UspA family protein